MDTVLITGGTGLIGTALSGYLQEKGYSIIILSRKPASFTNVEAIKYMHWNPEKNEIDEGSIKNSDYIIHLAGAGIADKRWTSKRKNEILNSRRQAGECIVQALQKIPNRVKAIIAASGIGWYTPSSISNVAKQEFRIESDPPDQSFLGETCRIWEASIRPVTVMKKRLVIYRTGIVLSRSGGAFPAFYRPARFGLAPILASGKQMMSWIHIDDLCRMYAEALGNENIDGVYNAVSPNPVSNLDLTIGLAKILKGNFFLAFHIPALLLKILFGGVSVELLKSVEISAEKIKKTGFQFLYPTATAAIHQLTRP